MSKEITGALFFSKEQPEISGYLVIHGEHYEIAGWRPSPIRAEITARPLGQRQAGQPDGGDERSGSGARERDPA